MRTRKPFRVGPAMRSMPSSRSRRSTISMSGLRFLSIAGIAGAILGAASIATTEAGRVSIAKTMRPLGIWSGIIRARSPEPGDYWRRCDEARAAGTAPIYVGEPGYRDGLDGDSDGIACEPYRGM